MRGLCRLVVLGVKPWSSWSLSIALVVNFPGICADKSPGDGLVADVAGGDFLWWRIAVAFPIPFRLEALPIALGADCYRV